jgi:hypothetical protein
MQFHFGKLNVSDKRAAVRFLPLSHDLLLA